MDSPPRSASHHRTSHRVVSFDMEGTLASQAFSRAIWHEDIPKLYAASRGLPLELARQEVVRAYDEVGEHRLEWYDIKYWFRRFGLTGHHELLLERQKAVSYYPEVREVLAQLHGQYPLIIISNSPREFLDVLAEGIKGYFHAIFSTLSDFGGMKCPEQYLKVCALLGVRPGEMVHTGDSREFDFEACRQAGIRAFHLVREGASPPCDDETITDLRQLLSRLAQAAA